MISAALRYLTHVKLLYGGVDSDFSWDCVGITPLAEIFVVPPHARNIASSSDTTALRSSLLATLSQILRSDDEYQDAVAAFDATFAT